MSALSEAIEVMRGFLNLRTDLAEASASIREFSGEMDDFNLRLTKLEAQWDTVMRLAALPQLQQSRRPRAGDLDLDLDPK